MHKLMIKTHTITGLKYLCYTQRDDHITYTGSGVLWKKHLKVHGDIFSTQLLYETENYKEFVEYARDISIKFNVVNDISWANLKLEEGDGGDTVSNRIWITDGENNKYIINTCEIPDKWYKGRSNCVFNDKNKQAEFSKRTDRVKAGISIKKTWDEGRFIRDHSKCGVSGDKNPSKRKEVKAKISLAALNRPNITCPHCGKIGKQSPGMYKFHFEKCKYNGKNNC